MTHNAHSTTSNCRFNALLGCVTRKFCVGLTDWGYPPDPRSQLHVVQRTLDPLESRLRHVRVPFGRLDAIMPQQLLDIADFGPVFQQVRRK